jgi:hypothetical protein
MRISEESEAVAVRITPAVQQHLGSLGITVVTYDDASRGSSKGRWELPACTMPAALQKAAKKACPKLNPSGLPDDPKVGRLPVCKAMPLVRLVRPLKPRRRPATDGRTDGRSATRVY